MNRSLLPILSGVVLTILTLGGCDSGTSDSAEPQFRVQFSFSGLDALQSGFHYQAWLKVGSEMLSTDAFNLDDEGRFVNLTGQFIASTFFVETDISGASMVMISIEGKGDNDTEPSGSIVLAGPVTGSTAVLSTTDANAVGTDYSSSSGTFALLTPTDTDPTNETGGVWLVNPGMGSSLSAGTSLSTPPSGWMYEGWVEINGVMLSMGKFSRSDALDTGKLYSDPDEISYPGEDFLNNPPGGVSFPPDLSGAAVYVTLEPNPDDSLDPYSYRLMEGQVPDAPSSRQGYPLAGSTTIPSGTASLIK